MSLVYDTLCEAVLRNTENIKHIEHLLKDNDNLEYLMYKATVYGNTDCIRFLMKYKVDTIINYSLEIAAEYGCYAVVKLLIENGADINTNYGAPLDAAATHGHVEVVKFLLESGADINVDILRGVVLAHRPEMVILFQYYYKDKVKFIDVLNDFPIVYRTVIQIYLKNYLRNIVKIQRCMKRYLGNTNRWIVV